MDVQRAPQVCGAHYLLELFCDLVQNVVLNSEQVFNRNTVGNRLEEIVHCDNNPCWLDQVNWSLAMATFISHSSRIAALEARIEQLELENEALQDLCNQGQDEINDLAEENAELRNELAELSDSQNNSSDEHLTGGFVGTPGRPHFHRPECEWVIGRSVIWFENHEAAVAAGRKPCKTCRA